MDNKVMLDLIKGSGYIQALNMDLEVKM